MFIQYYQCKRCFSLDMRIQLEKDGWRRGKQETERENKEKWEGKRRRNHQCLHCDF